MATIRQKLAASKLSENIRNGRLMKSLGQILKEVGYSESVCKHPDRVTDTKGWQELTANMFISDEELLSLHRELLFAKKVRRLPGNKYFTEMDGNTVAKALDMAYRLKGYYTLAKRQPIQQDEYKDIPEEELNRQIIAGFIQEGIIKPYVDELGQTKYILDNNYILS